MHPRSPAGAHGFHATASSARAVILAGCRLNTRLQRTHVPLHHDVLLPCSVHRLHVFGCEPTCRKI